MDKYCITWMEKKGETMPANYFYGPQAEQFAFYRIPKALFTDPAYRGISTDAKVL